MTVRKLRSLREGGRFESEFKALSQQAQARVLGVLRELRTDAELPGPADIDELIPPCVPGGWSRRVPDTNLWVFYDFYGTGEDVVLVRTVRVPRTLSQAARDALEEEANKPAPIPYLRPVPDDPDGAGESDEE